jgi:hypothetical protein
MNEKQKASLIDGLKNTVSSCNGRRDPTLLIDQAKFTENVVARNSLEMTILDENIHLAFFDHIHLLTLGPPFEDNGTGGKGFRTGLVCKNVVKSHGQTGWNVSKRCRSNSDNQLGGKSRSSQHGECDDFLTLGLKPSAWAFRSNPAEDRKRENDREDKSPPKRSAHDSEPGQEDESATEQ